MEQNGKDRVTNPPGETNKPFKKTVEVNGHEFTFKRRTYNDYIKIRIRACNILSAHTTPEMALTIVNSFGIEFKMSELAICLEKAPDHWYRENEVTQEKEIYPEGLYEDMEYFDEVMEVYRELQKFLESFRRRDNSGADKGSNK